MGKDFMNKVLFLILIVLTMTVHASVTRQISVSGQCLKSVFPNRGTITITPTALEKTSQAALKKVGEQYEALRNQVKSLDLKDIEMQTTEYTVKEEQVWNGKSNKYEKKGYRANFGLSISTSDLARIGEVVVIATKLNIEDVGSLNTFLSPELAKSTHESCLQEAIRNAREKADKMVTAAGSRTGKVITINENPKSQSPEYDLEASYTMSDEMAQSRVSQKAKPNILGLEAKPVKISVSISAVFGIE